MYLGACILSAMVDDYLMYFPELTKVLMPFQNLEDNVNI